MAVILFKKGTGEPQKFDEYLFASSLSSGWCLTQEEALKPDEPEVVEPEETEVVETAEEVIDITNGLTNKQIRTMAKEANIKNYKKARINKLKEALNDAQG